MRSKLRTALFGAAVFLTRQSVAGADEPPAAANTFAPFGGGVGATVGLGTPTGLLGIEGQLNLQSWLFVTAGVGLGTAGPQVAGMVHMRRPLQTETGVAFTLGYGISGGRYHEHLCIFESCDPELGGTLWWHNVQAGVEVKIGSSTKHSSWTMRPFGGVAVAGNPHDLECLDCNGYQRKVDVLWWPMLGVTVACSFH
jgi:hypothetical protein